MVAGKEKDNLDENTVAQVEKEEVSIEKPKINIVAKVGKRGIKVKNMLSRGGKTGIAVGKPVVQSTREH